MKIDRSIPVPVSEELYVWLRELGEQKKIPLGLKIRWILDKAMEEDESWDNVPINVRALRMLGVAVEDDET